MNVCTAQITQKKHTVVFHIKRGWRLVVAYSSSIIQKPAKRLFVSDSNPYSLRINHYAQSKQSYTEQKKKKKKGKRK
jgi:hypothetical protein